MLYITPGFIDILPSNTLFNPGLHKFSKI